ncbi:MAG: single-stranded-DNA-specific exonuclease RecJ [Pseudomonadota bacterium]
MSEDRAFFGVERSVTGRRWIGPNIEQDRAAETLSQEMNLPRQLSQVLARLGVMSSEVETYLAPSLKKTMPDPMSLRDMEVASTRLTQAVASKERIAVFADYDVDGAASGALLIDWFGHFGIKATHYVPDRIDEGYGPNAAAISNLSATHDLIICVDCGTLSHEALSAASCDVIVLDHHLGGETLPRALAVVNPNRQDEDGTLSYLCAAGVVFLTLVAANSALKAMDIEGPNLLEALDIVALATVADVAPLVAFNRTLVRQGLTVMTARGRLGLRALADVAGMQTAPRAYHLGFLLGPRINAGGRVGQADLGLRLLATQDPNEAEALALRLNDLNEERRTIEAEVQVAALAQAHTRDVQMALTWAAGEGWHPGVVGIVASRMKEATNRPSIVIGFDGDEGKGSGRSVSGIDLGNAIAILTREGLIRKGGGHKMAAGLSLSRAQLEPAMARLTTLLSKQGADKFGPQDVKLDGILSPVAATIELLEQIETAGPFGTGAPAPRFAVPFVKVGFARRVGDTHLQISFRDDNGHKIDAIAFKAFEGPLGQTLENHDGAVFHVAGRIEIDEWQGRRKAKLRLEDVALAKDS